jgi:hypothetical protein
MKTSFLFITKTTTAISSSGRSMVEVSREIKVVHKDIGAAATEYLEDQKVFVDLNVGWGDTLYNTPVTDADGWRLAFSFTGFDATMVPHYAKQLAPEELARFKTHAIDEGVVFVEGPL